MLGARAAWALACVAAGSLAKGAGEIEEMRALGLVSCRARASASSTLSEAPLMFPRSTRCFCLAYLVYPSDSVPDDCCRSGSRDRDRGGE
jgi:hypothetical protein